MNTTITAKSTRAIGSQTGARIHHQDHVPNGAMFNNFNRIKNTASGPPALKPHGFDLLVSDIIVGCVS